MAQNTGIQWCEHTFNAWWGCTKVHSGCASCYAEVWDSRWGGDHWGKTSRRMIVGEWGNPDKWNAAAKKAGKPAKVFASSMCDVFEDFDGPVVDSKGKTIEGVSLHSLRAKLWPIIERTPWLVWLMLTKRPENVLNMVPPAWLEKWPENVWTGTSPCDQATADKYIPALLKIQGNHFLSVEPMLGAVRLPAWFKPVYDNGPGQWKGYKVPGYDIVTHGLGPIGIHWLICGGESEQRGQCRPFPVEDASDLREQCRECGIPFFMKQLGSLPSVTVSGKPLASRKGDDMAEWPEWARCREFPASMAVAP